MGFVFVFNRVIGRITPPLGICLFVGCTIAGISLETLSKAIWPFIVMLVVVLLVFSYVPSISMIVPQLFHYKESSRSRWKFSGKERHGRLPSAPAPGTFKNI